jgi:ketosteroid isomerase-like protein
MTTFAHLRAATARLGTVLAVGVLASTAASPARAQMEGPEADAVREREIAFAQTMADRDFDAFQTFIHPDAVFFNGNEPMRGRAAVAEAWRGFFEAPEAPFAWAPDLVQVLESGGLALSSGPVMAGGEEVGRFNSIWRQGDDGVWMVVFDKGS